MKKQNKKNKKQFICIEDNCSNIVKKEGNRCHACAVKNHKPNCKCCICKAKRKEYYGINHPSYKHGKQSKYIIHYCIEDGCNNIVTKGGNMCGSCRSNKSHKINCPCSFCKSKRGESKGINHNKFKHGKYSKEFFGFCIKPGCDKKLSRIEAKRCNYHAIIERFKDSKNHPAYIDGRSFLTALIRASKKYIDWRKKILKRDNYTCQKCFKKGDNLEVHHIKSFKSVLEKFLNFNNQFSPIEDKELLVKLAIDYDNFWDLSIGQTLCKDCHNRTKK